MLNNVSDITKRVNVLNAQGSKYYLDGNLQAARLHFLAAYSLDQNNELTLQNLSAVLFSLEKYAAAVACARRAVSTCTGPQLPFIKSNLGSSLVGLRRYAEAQRLMREVVRKVPQDGNAHHNMALALYMTGHLQESLSFFEKAQAMLPNAHAIKSDKALAQLSLGEIKNGLENYEIRWNLLKKMKPWELGVPEWQGEPVNGRKLLVHHEQGFGDTLMLCRWIEPLLEMGAHVTVAVPPELIRLIECSFPGLPVIDWCAEDMSNDFDFHTPLLSTMRWLNIDLESNFRTAPYLRAGASEASNALPDAKFRVGVCWASGDHGAALRNRRRVVSLEHLLPLLEIDGVRVISLQKGREATEIEDFGVEGLIFNPMQRVVDFYDTASIIDKLDLVISVDSAVVHLAAAMGKPTLMLGPYTRCWRWWSPTSGEPWYKHMRIYRQAANGSWTTACASVVQQVRGMAVTRSHHLHQNGVRNG